MPADHAIFKEMNAAQWMWYFYNYAKDMDDDFIKNRNLIEYHAGFIEPEGVRQIINSRENAIETKADDFQDNLKNIFGRNLPAGAMSSDGKIHSASPDKSAVKNHGAGPKEGSEKAKNYKDWIDLDLE